MSLGDDDDDDEDEDNEDDDKEANKGQEGLADTVGGGGGGATKEGDAKKKDGAFSSDGVDDEVVASAINAEAKAPVPPPEEEEEGSDGAASGNAGTANAAAAESERLVTDDHPTEHNEEEDGSTSSAYVDRLELADDEGGETTNPDSGVLDDDANPADVVGGGASDTLPLPPASSPVIPSESEASAPPLEQDSRTPQSEAPHSAPDGSKNGAEHMIKGAGDGAPAAANATEASAAETGREPAEKEEAEESESAPARTTTVSRVSDEMRRTLSRKLGYTHKEVDSIKPAFAVVAIQKRLHRPWEGMPPSWYRTEEHVDDEASAAAASSSSSCPPLPWSPSRQKWVTKAAVLAVVGAAIVQSRVVASGSALDASGPIAAILSAFRDWIVSSQLFSSSRGRSAAASSSSSSASRSLSVSPSSAVEPDDSTDGYETTQTAPPMPHGSAPFDLPERRGKRKASPPATLPPPRDGQQDPLPVNEHVNAPNEPHEHSLRPGTTVAMDESDLDVTWLDKAITAVERRIRSVLGGGSSTKGSISSEKKGTSAKVARDP
jgi:hypothetical protein